MHMYVQILPTHLRLGAPTSLFPTGLSGRIKQFHDPFSILAKCPASAPLTDRLSDNARERSYYVVFENSGFYIIFD